MKTEQVSIIPTSRYPDTHFLILGIWVKADKTDNSPFVGLVRKRLNKVGTACRAALINHTQ